MVTAMNVQKEEETLVRHSKKRSTLTLLGMTLIEIELPQEQRRKLSTSKGVSVLVTVPGSESHRGGMRNGDTVVEVNGRKIGSLQEMRSALGRHDPRDPIFIFVLTGEVWRFINLSLIKMAY
jgi:S1-C subfamily serine protease